MATRTRSLVRELRPPRAIVLVVMLGGGDHATGEDHRAFGHGLRLPRTFHLVFALRAALPNSGVGISTGRIPRASIPLRRESVRSTVT